MFIRRASSVRVVGSDAVGAVRGVRAVFVVVDALFEQLLSQLHLALVQPLSLEHQLEEDSSFTELSSKLLHFPEAVHVVTTLLFSQAISLSVSRPSNICYLSCAFQYTMR